MSIKDAGEKGASSTIKANELKDRLSSAIRELDAGKISTDKAYAMSALSGELMRVYHRQIQVLKLSGGVPGKQMKSEMCIEESE